MTGLAYLSGKVCAIQIQQPLVSMGEQVRTVYLYSNSMNGGRFAGIKVVTDRQECEAYAGNYTPRAEDQVEVAVGTGKWNGMFGRSAVDIDSFGVAMLKY